MQELAECRNFACLSLAMLSMQSAVEGISTGLSDKALKGCDNNNNKVEAIQWLPVQIDARWKQFG